jgi:hypothetical protein
MRGDMMLASTRQYTSSGKMKTSMSKALQRRTYAPGLGPMMVPWSARLGCYSSCDYGLFLRECVHLRNVLVEMVTAS